ncbi:MAG: hypothetical protein RSB29_05240 [Alistipes sp.]
MKRKNLFFCALLAVATLGFASCSECDDPPKPNIIYEKGLTLNLKTDWCSLTHVRLYLCANEARAIPLQYDAIITAEMYSENQLMFVDSQTGSATSEYLMAGALIRDESHDPELGCGYSQIIPCVYKGVGEYEFAFKVHSILHDTYYITPRYRLTISEEHGPLQHSAKLTEIK